MRAALGLLGQRFDDANVRHYYLQETALYPSLPRFIKLDDLWFSYVRDHVLGAPMRTKVSLRSNDRSGE